MNQQVKHIAHYDYKHNSEQAPHRLHTKQRLMCCRV